MFHKKRNVSCNIATSHQQCPLGLSDGNEGGSGGGGTMDSRGHSIPHVGAVPCIFKKTLKDVNLAKDRLQFDGEI